MPEMIDVSGLPPEAIRAVQTVVDVFRKQAAQPGPAQPPPGSIPPSQLPYEEWVKWFRAWVDSHPKRDIEIDDDRESIYDRSCE